MISTFEAEEPIITTRPIMTTPGPYELKLADGRRVVRSGKDPVDAATRYVDAHRDAVVVAARPADRHGMFPGQGRIIG